MPFLVIGQERFALQIGETRIGGTGDDAAPFPELASLPIRATISVLADGSATIRPVGSSPVYVNGLPADAGGTRLAHGMRLDVDGVRILFGDVRSSGNTIHLTGASAKDLTPLDGLTLPEGTASTGGRLTPRRGGLPFGIPETGVEIGRDPSCGLVLTSKDVSRRHARIAPGILGYVITDLSVNGVLVNGARIDSSRVLGQGDVIRIGTEEWVFAADKAQPMPGAVATSGIADPLRAPAPASATPAPPTPAPVLLATLEIINEGIHKGTRFRIERPVVHIGRGSHNDIVLSDDSVSSSHATLARRGAEWIVRDLDSTNGTYADGQRLTDEQAMRGPTEVRFGGVKMLFRPIAASGAGLKTKVVATAKKTG